MKLLTCLFAAATAVCAADVSGKWSGTSEFVNRDGQPRTMPIVLLLKQSGDQLEGTTGPSAEQQREIQNGKFAANQVTFDVPDEGGKAVVSLTLAGDTLKGEAKFHREYGVITMKLALERK